MRFRHAPGLDGIRALAVLAVFAYHVGTQGDGHEFLPGGFIGVDIFFVLSGYLITSLLVVERLDTKRISIRKFYIRRARRLLPALIALLLVIGLIGVFWVPDQVARLRGDLLAALGYVINWWLIAQETSYFGDGTRPPLVTHLWSLAVEEQFYLIWPLALMLLMRGGRRFALWILAFAIAGSVILAAVLYDPWGDPTRVYFGTDTRAATPLIGAAAAILFRSWGTPHPRGRWAWDVFGFAGLGLLVVIGLFLGDNDPELYQGGFLVIAVLAALLVVSAGRPDTLMGKILGTQPLRWLGDRSYAFYLWHWPVCVLTRPGTDIPITGWANALLRLAITLALAELSYWLVERPIRYGPLFRFHLPNMRAATAAVVTFTVVLAGAVGVALARPTAPPPSAPVGGGPAVKLSPIAIPSAFPSASGTPRTPPIKVALFGDSQATSLFANIPEDLDKYLLLSDQSITGCGIMPGRMESSTGERFDPTRTCPHWMDDWRNKAAGADAEVALVVLGAWEVFDLITPTGTLVFGTPEWDATFKAALTQGINAIQESGAQVVLAQLPCYRPKPGGSAGYWPERGEHNRTQHVNELLKQLAPTVTPPIEYCTDEEIATNKWHRWDGVHYWKPGAALYFSTIVPQLLALPS